MIINTFLTFDHFYLTKSIQIREWLMVSNEVCHERVFVNTLMQFLFAD